METSGGELELMGPPQDHLLMMPNGVFDTGVANHYPDGDRLVRTFYPVVIPEKEFPGVGFAMQLVLRATGGDTSAPSWTCYGGETYPRYVNGGGSVSLARPEAC